MPLTRDQELWACALEVEKREGRGAWSWATMRMEDLEGQGDHEGADTWREIRTRILSLRKGIRGQRH
jgi:hypothetical protein